MSPTPSRPTVLFEDQKKSMLYLRRWTPGHLCKSELSANRQENRERTPQEKINDVCLAQLSNPVSNYSPVHSDSLYGPILKKDWEIESGATFSEEFVAMNKENYAQRGPK